MNKAIIRLRRWLGLFAFFAVCPLQAETLEVKIIYLEQQRTRPPVLSNLIVHPEDEGEQGALLGISDNNTTGKFLKQSYSLEIVVVPPEEDIVAVATGLLNGANLVVANMPSDKLLQIADLPQAADDLIFNAGSSDNRLRDSNAVLQQKKMGLALSVGGQSRR